MGVIGIIIGAIVIVLLFVIVKYNGIIALRNNREQSFADIDTQLQLRFDLIPNLIETVKGYAKHESETIIKTVEARKMYDQAENADQKIEASNMLTGALKSIFALSEAYPDLKANTNFLELQTELSDVENKLAAARRFFNAATKEFNTYIEMFPTNIIAGMFSISRALSFEVENREETVKVPKVKF